MSDPKTPALPPPCLPALPPARELLAVVPAAGPNQSAYHPDGKQHAPLAAWLIYSSGPPTPVTAKGPWPGATVAWEAMT